jgi:Cu-processing system permease protein
VNTLTIARFTIQEAISRRLVAAGLVLSLVFVGLYALGFALLYGRALQEVAARPGTAQALVVAAAMLTTLGLYSVHFLSGFLALFLSVGAVSGEIDSGALHAVLARPLRRSEYVLGRWLGLVGLTGVYVGLMAALLLLLARLIAGYEPPEPIRAIGLMILGAVALLTVSLFGSTLLSTLANGVVVFTLFGLAWLGGIIETVGGGLSNPAMVNLGIVVSLLIPSDAIWRGASYYVQSPAFLLVTANAPFVPFLSSEPPATPFVVWAAIYPLVFLAGAVLAFSRRDL